ncbi:hypothetical protein [Edaphobacter albus]|uniref:hypothetical protein n=1 Tax=Edaphobacter sp. 4G125 TaxID=2763071 RepID=UPI00164948D3|nr:hypothetical protein [Edaphobacter sp. 4G125]QNI38312.1 hypothetical protein H7846_08760 [Edaphobacter sp. 4G125]
MKSPRVAVVILALPLILLVGCSSPRPYAYAPPPPPPPPYNSVPPLIDRANHEGFRIGVDAGTRDAYRGFSYQPRRDRAFHDTPGYDPALGPYGPYRDAFRNAYLRGYDRGFYRR